jgi:hypothetical protein
MIALPPSSPAPAALVFRAADGSIIVADEDLDKAGYDRVSAAILLNLIAGEKIHFGFRGPDGRWKVTYFRPTPGVEHGSGELITMDAPDSVNGQFDNIVAEWARNGK